MSTTREVGWWLPEPKARFDAPSTVERTRRYRLVGAWIVRLWLVICAGFGGLLWSDPHTSGAQAFFGTVVFVGSTGLLLVLGLCIAFFAGP